MQEWNKNSCGEVNATELATELAINLNEKRSLRVIYLYHVIYIIVHTDKNEAEKKEKEKKNIS